MAFGGAGSGTAGTRPAMAAAVLVLIVLGLAFGATAYAAEPRASVSLPGDVATEPVTVGYEGRQLSFRLLGARGKMVGSGQQASASNVLPGVTLRYSFIPGGVKEELVISRREAAPKAFEFELKTSPGLELLATRDKRLLAVDRSRQLRMFVPAPFMEDAAKPKAAVSRAIGLQLRRVRANTYRLTLTPSRRWLAADERRFPIVVDPTVLAEPAAVNAACCAQCPFSVDDCLSRAAIPTPQCDLDDPRKSSIPPGCHEIRPATYVFQGADPNRTWGPKTTTCLVTMEAGAGRLQGTELRIRTKVDCDTRMNRIEVWSSLWDTARLRGASTHGFCQMHTTPACPDPARLTTPIGYAGGLTPGVYQHRITIFMRLPNADGDPWTVVPSPGSPPDARCVALVGSLEVQCNLVHDFTLEPSDDLLGGPAS